MDNLVSIYLFLQNQNKEPNMFLHMFEIDLKQNNVLEKLDKILCKDNYDCINQADKKYNLVLLHK